VRAVRVFSIGVSGIGAIIAITALELMQATAISRPSQAEAAVDAEGNLHVPRDYQTIYQPLGSWAVAADEGRGSKELHVVLASPGSVEAYRKEGRFPDGAVLVKEVFKAATLEMTTGAVSHADELVRHGEGQRRPLSGPRLVGRWVGVVVVRRCQPHKDNIHRLQTELQVLPRSGAGDRLGLRRGVSCIEAIKGTLRGQLDLPHVVKLNKRSNRWRKRL
jgi:hypothetical protein